MMKYYREISLLPQEDIDLYFVWRKLYQQIHLALADNKNVEGKSFIGSGFPEYSAERYCLGKKLRLFAEDDKMLKRMNCDKWLARLSDYLHLTRIRPVPEKVTEHVCFKHVKLKGGKEKLARRRAKRKGETLAQALVYFENYKQQASRLPYINMISQTNGHSFRLFIEKQMMETPRNGLFSCFGLSHQTTVPMF